MKQCTVCAKELYKTNTSGLCHRHGQKKGDEHYRKKGMFTGKNAGHYKTGKSLSYGYVRVLSPDHPFCDKTTKYVLEHRLLVEKYLGRYLKREEDVHHIDGNRSNNVISNLMAFDGRSSHRRYEMGGICHEHEIVFDGRKA